MKAHKKKKTARNLNDRQRKILKVVIQSHIDNAMPIGSSAVSKVIDLSSATIRNVMGELEDMGYIAKPHTSAGRIPTIDGYRYFVDNLLKLGRVSTMQKAMIEQDTYWRNDRRSIELVLDKISRLLSIMTHYAGLACLSQLQFYIQGASYMIEMPEFRDPERVKMLLRLLDERAELLDLLRQDTETEGIKIHIGGEEQCEALRDLSLITANYRVRDDEKGSLGILGPVRMQYAMLIPLVEFLSHTIETLFEEMEW